MSVNSFVEQPDIGKDTNQALVDAFLRGAGIRSNALGAGPNSKLTPETMELLGKLLAVSIHGIHELLAKRALVKREVNADVTMVVNRNNNPLKFLQDGDTILMHMLRKKMPGFMEPVESMQEAFSDLHTHQSAILAGVHGALDDMLHRFDPSEISAAVEGSALQAVLPPVRNSKLWGEYLKRYAATRQDLKNQSSIGSAFLDAYEKEVERRENESSNG